MAGWLRVYLILKFLLTLGRNWKTSESSKWFKNLKIRRLTFFERESRQVKRILILNLLSNNKMKNKNRHKIGWVRNLLKFKAQLKSILTTIKKINLDTNKKTLMIGGSKMKVWLYLLSTRLKVITKLRSISLLAPQLIWLTNKAKTGSSIKIWTLKALRPDRAT